MWRLYVLSFSSPFCHFFSGRIPGAVNVPYKTLIDVASGGYWPLPKLKQKLDECGLSLSLSLSRARARSLSLSLSLSLSHTHSRAFSLAL